MLLALLACGGSSSPVTPPPVQAPVLNSITISADGASLLIGSTLQLIGTGRDEQGRVMAVAPVWAADNSAVATVSSTGLVSGISAGSATIQARVGTVSGTYVVSVAAPVTAYVAGQSYFGRNNYIEYIAGNAPVILTAPHGGTLNPASIPDRVAAACGGVATTVTDLSTSELVRSMQQRYFARFGKYPHVIIANLSRRKLDANRLLTEAACGSPEAIAALDEWHAYIDIAKRAVLATSGRGWYMDMHGHAHVLQRLELGSLIANANLDFADVTLDGTVSFENTASIRTLSQASPLTFSALLRGPSSLGTLYANGGYPAIPSVYDPRPNGTDYFDGGDNTVRHTCGAGASALGGTTNGNICGVQIESNYTGVRDNAANRDRFGDVTAMVLEEYLRTHWGLRLASP